MPSSASPRELRLKSVLELKCPPGVSGGDVALAVYVHTKPSAPCATRGTIGTCGASVRPPFMAAVFHVFDARPVGRCDGVAPAASTRSAPRGASGARGGVGPVRAVSPLP